MASVRPPVVPTDAELEELAKSLDTPEIPSKLRCGICDLLAYNTLRLPCCNTNICESCYQTELTEECIICCHKPLDKTLCEPNKPMRITIKALLKRKFNDRAKRQADAIKAAPPEPSKKPDPEKEQTIASPGDKAFSESVEREPEQGASTLQAGDLSGAAVEPKEEDQKSNSETPNPLVQEHASGAGPDDKQPDGEAEADSGLLVDNAAQDGQWPADPGMNPNLMNGALGLGGMNRMNGMFPMDFSSMMTNGMMPMAGFPNMMGMGMMPMMSQMFGGLDGSNMGMNGMNMGMGFNGQNQFGGPWMNGQEPYNNNAFGNGNFGAQAGYNMSSHQNNYNQMNDQAYANNDFQRGYGRQGFQNRRGRRGYYNGGFGRNNYNQMNQGNQYGYANQDSMQQQLANQDPRAMDASVEEQAEGQPATGSMTKEQEEALMASFAPGGEHDFDEELGRTPQDESFKRTPDNAEAGISLAPKESMPAEPAVQDSTETRAAEENPTAEKPMEEAEGAAGSSRMEESADPEHVAPQPIQTFISDEPRSRNMPPPGPSIPLGPASQFGRGYNRAGMASTAPTEPRGLGVVGAPTGPRALREGRPNTGRSGLELSNANKAIAQESAKQGARARSKSRSPVRQGSATRSRSRSRSPSRRHHSSGHRSSKRHRSPSESADSRREHRDEKRHHRSYRYHEEDEREGNEPGRASRQSYRRHEDEGEGDESKRSSHRSHRRREEEYPEDDDARRSSKSHRRHDRDADASDRRRHRDRSRSKSPDRERDRGRGAPERDRHRYRDEEGEEDRRYRRKRSRSPTSSVAPTPTMSHAPEFPGGYEDHGPRKRRTKEREADDEERYDRKRSRREYSNHESKPPTPATPNFPESASSSRRGSVMANGGPHTQQGSKHIPTGPRASTQRSREGERELEHEAATPSGSKTDKDMHTLEREARDRERLQREMQRRAYMDGGHKRKSSGNAGSGRRVSYKYEDEDGVDARRVEREREASRWS